PVSGSRTFGSQKQESHRDFLAWASERQKQHSENKTLQRGREVHATGNDTTANEEQSRASVERDVSSPQAEHHTGGRSRAASVSSSPVPGDPETKHSGTTVDWRNLSALHIDASPDPDHQAQREKVLRSLFGPPGKATPLGGGPAPGNSSRNVSRTSSGSSLFSFPAEKGRSQSVSLPSTTTGGLYYDHHEASQQGLSGPAGVVVSSSRQNKVVKRGDQQRLTELRRQMSHQTKQAKTSVEEAGKASSSTSSQKKTYAEALNNATASSAGAAASGTTHATVTEQDDVVVSPEQ
ncbi:unnamed protein product, partial [Amoebophrya sp. A120]